MKLTSITLLDFIDSVVFLISNNVDIEVVFGTMEVELESLGLLNFSTSVLDSGILVELCSITVVERSTEYVNSLEGISSLFRSSVCVDIKLVWFVVTKLSETVELLNCDRLVVVNAVNTSSEVETIFEVDKIFDVVEISEIKLKNVFTAKN